MLKLLDRVFLFAKVVLLSTVAASAQAVSGNIAGTVQGATGGRAATPDSFRANWCSNCQSRVAAI